MRLGFGIVTLQELRHARAEPQHRVLRIELSSPRRTRRWRPADRRALMASQPGLLQHADTRAVLPPVKGRSPASISARQAEPSRQASYVEPNHTHQLQRVAVSNDAVTKLVVERHLAILRRCPAGARSLPARENGGDLGQRRDRAWSPSRSPRRASIVRTTPSAAMRRSLELVPLNSSSNRNRTGSGPSSRSQMRGCAAPRYRSPSDAPAANPCAAGRCRPPAASAAGVRREPARRQAPARR